MSLKKINSEKNEEPIYDDAKIYIRGNNWQFMKWLPKEGKYARISLKTTNKSTAIEKAKLIYHELMSHQSSGKAYFSKAVIQGVDEYLKQRNLDIDAGLIVKGRFGTIRTHLNHWLDFIGRDTKLKDLKRTDCENYFHFRTQMKNGKSTKQITVANEQTSINAMITWLFKRNETYIDAFDFKPLKRIDRGDEALRQASYEVKEISDIKQNLIAYIRDGRRNIDEKGNLLKVIIGYFFLLSILTGLRKGEQLQLKWKDIKFHEENIQGEADDEFYSLVQIKVRQETSKVRKTRTFMVKDWEYFDELYKLLYPRYIKSQGKGNLKIKPFGDTLIFSTDGVKLLPNRTIGKHFNKINELAGVEITDERKLALYSFRHYFITEKINEGYSMTQVAEMCGTSVSQIEKTYYHTTRAKMVTNALPNFNYKDGVLVPKKQHP